ncbi:MAG: hypothetical protein VKP63_03320 [Cyanobacteriota bacterium]|nr:hypothetical protein [Cyanobacteriota bacterium]
MSSTLRQNAQGSSCSRGAGFPGEDEERRVDVVRSEAFAAALVRLTEPSFWFGETSGDGGDGWESWLVKVEGLRNP